MYFEKYTKEEIQYIQSKPNILTSIIKKYPNENWNFFELSSNPNITWDIVDIFIQKNWDWDKLSISNPHINIEVVKKYVNYWDWKALSKNPYITEDIIYTFIDKPWDWSELSNNTKFIYIMKYTPRYEIDIHDFVEKNQDVICWKSLSQNTQLNFHLVKKYSDKPWDWSLLSNRSDLSVNFILKNINLPWNWHLIMLEKKIDIFQIINKFPHVKQCIYSPVESNPFITVEYLEKCITFDIHNREMFSNRFSKYIYYMPSTESLSTNKFLFNRNVLRQNMDEDNLINTILVFETICNKNSVAKNINCKSVICDYNIITIIKELLF